MGTPKVDAARPAPALCERPAGKDPSYPFDTDGYHQALECAHWRGDQRKKGQEIVATSPRGDDNKSVYEVSDSNKPWAPRQEPNVKTFAFYTCRGLADPHPETLTVPAKNGESQERLIDRLSDEAKNRLKKIDAGTCTLPTFDSFSFPLPEKPPAEKGPPKK